MLNFKLKIEELEREAEGEEGNKLEDKQIQILQTEIEALREKLVLQVL
jgi:hypothetical protein